MLTLLLIACGPDQGSISAAVSATEPWFEAPGNVIVQVSVEDPTQYRVQTGSGPWEGHDLHDALARCAPETVEAVLVLTPGGWPWDLVEAPEDLCAAEVLSRFPFVEPRVEGARDVVRLRLTAERDSVPAQTWSSGRFSREPALIVPPSFVVSEDADAIDLDSLRVVSGHPRWRRTGTVVQGRLEGAERLARSLSCPDEAAALVRVVLGFTDGDLEEIRVTPESDCVEEKAREEEFEMVMLNGQALRTWPVALVTLDVPVGPW